MEFFDQFSDTLISTGKMVGEKAKDIADVTKLSYQIRALEQEIHEKYQELGKVLYEANEAGEELPDESDVFEVIREKKEEVDELVRILNTTAEELMPEIELKHIL